MLHSDQVTELFTALSKALGEIESLPLNKTNPHFKSKYADLAITIEKAKPALMKHGLMLLQAVENEGNKYVVESMITHSSGQWLKSKVELLLTKQDMQGLGSATTYAKRYAAQSLLFVAGDEDDDGNAASQGGAKKDAKEKQPEAPKTPQGPTVPMLKRLYAIGHGMGWPPESVRVYCMAKVQRTPGKLSKAQYDKLCDVIGGSPYDEMQVAQIENMFEALTDQQKTEIKGD
jgi:hypothetical protein